MNNTDIDIDFPDRNLALSVVTHIQAAMTDGTVVDRQKHISGVYLQDIPCSPYDGMSVYDYKTAGNLGYFKIDFLNNHIYDGVRDEKHLQELVDREPMWEMLEDPDIVEDFPQVSGHFDILYAIRPRSVIDLAVCLALIRPAARSIRDLTREEIDDVIWTLKDTGGYSYKKSHAVAFAVSLVVKMNLLVEELDNEDEDADEQNNN